MINFRGYCLWHVWIHKVRAAVCYKWDMYQWAYNERILYSWSDIKKQISTKLSNYLKFPNALYSSSTKRKSNLTESSTDVTRNFQRTSNDLRIKIEGGWIGTAGSILRPWAHQHWPSSPPFRDPEWFKVFHGSGTIFPCRQPFDGSIGVRCIVQRFYRAHRDVGGGSGSTQRRTEKQSGSVEGCTFPGCGESEVVHLRAPVQWVFSLEANI